MAIESVINGAVVVKNVPDGACFTTFADLLRSLGNYLSVVIPNQDFSNLVVSVQQPGVADQNKIWWQISGSGSFVGVKVFSGGVWVQVLPAPNQIFWLYGDSDNPPPGFSFAAVNTLFSAPHYAELIALAVPNGGVPPFVYFPVVWVGL